MPAPDSEPGRSSERQEWFGTTHWSVVLTAGHDNGLPFVPTDLAIHDLLEARSVADSEQLQIAVGKLRRVNHHFQGRLLAIDPHRMKSFSKRQMRRRQSGAHAKAEKIGQCFFCLDADTQQPVCFTLSSSAPDVTQLTPHLLEMAAAILNPEKQATKPLVMADKEHFSAELIDAVTAKGPFDLLIPMPRQHGLLRQWEQLPPKRFKTHWPGYAIARESYRLGHSQTHDCFQFIQRTGARSPYPFEGFFSTRDRLPLPDLTVHYPKRWHVEELFKLREHYENLEEKLGAEGISNKVPWLYNFKLDFRFK